MPELYIIGGANGAGKTTVSLNLLPNYLKVFEYVNADAIAAGISPFNSESVAIQAGRLMLKRLQLLSRSSADFAFETTLASRSYSPFIKNCKNQGYTINLIYFWLKSPELAIERVQRRVESGGHSVPEEVIRRRYKRGLSNLIYLYLPLCDYWISYDNSNEVPEPIAEGGLNQKIVIYNDEIFNQILGEYNGAPF